MLDEIVRRISEATGADADTIIAEVGRTREDLNVDTVVAALILAYERGADITGLVDEVDRDLVRRARHDLLRDH